MCVYSLRSGPFAFLQIVRVETIMDEIVKFSIARPRRLVCIAQGRPPYRIDKRKRYMSFWHIGTIPTHPLAEAVRIPFSPYSLYSLPLPSPVPLPSPHAQKLKAFL